MIQQQIFNKIIAQYSDSSEAIHAIGKALHLNPSNVYRRVSGEIPLKLDEIEQLAKRFNLYLDELIYQDSDRITGRIIGSQKNRSNNYSEYLIHQLQKTNAIPGFKMCHASADWSVIFYFRYVDLYLFKVSQWKRLLWKSEQSPVYHRHSHSAQQRSTILRIGHLFQGRHTVFFLCKSTADLLLGQIEYAYSMNQISKSDALYLLEEYDKMLDDVEACTTVGQTSLHDKAKPFDVFLVHTPILGSITLFTSKSLKYVDVVFNSPNFIKSKDKKMLNYAEQYLERLENSATKISQTGEMARRKLFAHYRNQVNKSRKILGA